MRIIFGSFDRSVVLSDTLSLLRHCVYGHVKLTSNITNIQEEFLLLSQYSKQNTTFGSRFVSERRFLNILTKVKVLVSVGDITHVRSTSKSDILQHKGHVFSSLHLLNSISYNSPDSAVVPKYHCGVWVVRVFS